MNLVLFIIRQSTHLNTIPFIRKQAHKITFILFNSNPTFKMSATVQRIQFAALLVAVMAFGAHATPQFSPPSQPTPPSNFSSGQQQGEEGFGELISLFEQFVQAFVSVFGGQSGAAPSPGAAAPGAAPASL